MARGRASSAAAALGVLAVLTALVPLARPAPAADDARPTAEAVSVWQHRLPGGDWDVYYGILGRPAPSDPGSALRWWTPDGPTAAPIAALPGDDENPTVAVSPASGVAIAAWQHRRPDGTQDIFWSALALSGSGGWTAPAPVATTPGDDFDPTLAIDADGTALAVWVETTSDGSGLRWSTWVGTAWTPPEAVPGTLGAASLPEVTFLSREADLAGQAEPGARTPHQALVAYSDLVLDPQAGAVHRTRVALWNGSGFAPAETLPFTVEQATGLREHGWADYTKPLGAFDRLDVGAESDGGAVVLWGGAASADNVWGLTSVMGSRLDPATGVWEALRWTDNTVPGGTIGCASRHSPALAMTGSADLVVAFGSHDALDFARRVRGAYASEGQILDTPKADLRPSLAPLSDRVLMVSWSRPYPALRDPSGSTIAWSLGTLRPPFGDARSTATWEPAGTIDLPGDSRYPEVASVKGAGAPHVTMGGRAYGARAQVEGEADGPGAVTLADTGAVASDMPGDDAAREPVLTPHQLVTVTGFTARSSRSADTSLSTVAVEEVAIETVPRVVVRGLWVEAQASCPFGQGAATKVGSVQVGAGPPTAVSARTNTAIPLGLFVLRVNEQRSDFFNASVNGLHLTGPGVDVVVGRAEAAVAGCVGTGPPAATSGGHDH